MKLWILSSFALQVACSWIQNLFTNLKHWRMLTLPVSTSKQCQDHKHATSLVNERWTRHSIVTCYRSVYTRLGTSVSFGPKNIHPLFVVDHPLNLMHFHSSLALGLPLLIHISYPQIPFCIYEILDHVPPLASSPTLLSTAKHAIWPLSHALAPYKCRETPEHYTIRMPHLVVFVRTAVLLGLCVRLYLLVVQRFCILHIVRANTIGAAVLNDLERDHFATYLMMEPKNDL